MAICQVPTECLWTSEQTLNQLKNLTDLWIELHLNPQQKTQPVLQLQFVPVFCAMLTGLQEPSLGLCLSKRNSALLTELHLLIGGLILTQDFWTSCLCCFPNVIVRCWKFFEQTFYKREQKYIWGMTAGLQTAEIPENPSVLLSIQRSAGNITMATILTQWKKHAIIRA